MSTPNVFVSYSWDNASHMEWVAYLVNELRKKGINADFDRNITQQGTVNLNRMMVENFRLSDYIIVVLTENYAQRANEHKGGVGLETTFLENELLNNTKKIIPIKRSKGNDSEVIPYCLNGLVYIDFSDDSKFEGSLNELLYKIYGVNQFQLEPLGEKPDLTPRKVQYKNEDNDITVPDINLIPNLKQITDLDKKKYMKISYEKIKEELLNLSKSTKKHNNNFEFELEQNGDFDYRITFYLNGLERTRIRFWLGNMMGFGEHSIFISYDKYNFSNNSFNEMITCEVKNNELKLKMTMNVLGFNGDTVEEIAKQLWKNICGYLTV